MRIVKQAIKKIIERTGVLHTLYEAYSLSRHRGILEQAASTGDLRLHLGCGQTLLEAQIVRLGNAVSFERRFPFSVPRYARVM